MIPLRTSIKILTLGPLMEFKFSPKCPLSPRISKGAPREGQRHPHGTQMTAKGRPRAPKGSQREPKGTPKGSQRAPRVTKRRPKSVQRRPKAPQKAQLYIQTPDQPPKRPVCYNHKQYLRTYNKCRCLTPRFVLMSSTIYIYI